MLQLSYIKKTCFFSTLNITVVVVHNETHEGHFIILFLYLYLHTRYISDKGIPSM